MHKHFSLYLSMHVKWKVILNRQPSYRRSYPGRIPPKCTKPGIVPDYENPFPALASVRTDKNRRFEEIKSIFLPTPHEGMAMLLNYRELKSFAGMLDLADDEEKALSLLQLFDQ